jgi:hypothetical protein
MEYKDFFSPSTLAKLDKQSAENLKQMLGDKTLMQTMVSSQQLLGQIAKAEAPYKDKLEKLAIDIVKELYPIIDEEGITIDAKIVSMGDVNKSLDESISPESRRRIINAITQGAAVRGSFAFYLFKEHLDEIDPSLVEKYNEIMKNTFGVYDDENAIAMFLAMLAQGHKAAGGSSKITIKEIKINKPGIPEFEKLVYKIEKINRIPHHLFYKELLNKYNYPGGTISFASFWKSLSNIDKINFYNELDNYVVKNNINESQESGITITARAINFPMLVHEIVKGLFELISLQGFKGSKEQNQAVVDKVDTLKNEPYDLKYGKFIYDALRNIAVNNNAEPRTIPYFFAEVYKMDDEEFIEFVENSILGKLTSEQERWVKITIREIEDDLKADSTGLDEIKIAIPGKQKYNSFKKFKEELEREIIKTFPINNEFKNEYPQSVDEYGRIKNYNDTYLTKTGKVRRLKLGFPSYVHYIYGPDIKNEIFDVYEKIATKYGYEFKKDNNFTVYFKDKIDEVKINDPNKLKDVNHFHSVFLKLLQDDKDREDLWQLLKKYGYKTNTSSSFSEFYNNLETKQKIQFYKELQKL